MARQLLRWAGLLAGASLVGAGGLGWAMRAAAGSSALEEAPSRLGPLAGLARSLLGGAQPGLADPMVASLLLGLGLAALAAGVVAGRRRVGRPADDAPDPRLVRKAARQAALLARKGDAVAAAELCVHAGLLDDAVRHLEAAQEFVRAAEIRHDQNRFLEAAALFARGGNFEAAGTIYASHNELVRAAECYRKAGRHTVAGETYQRAGDARRAGECYAEAGFHREAADCYARAQCWAEAGRALERWVGEEAHSADSPRRREEQRQAAVKAALFHEQAGELGAALAVLERARCWARAAEIALRLHHFARAAELFLEARDGPRAAEALRQIGEDKAAARILGEHYRDQGDDEEAALQLEAAGELLDAGDLYRKLERFEKAGECYERHGDGVQAAEMFEIVGEHVRAATSYERAGRFPEAARCWAEAGDRRHQAEVLARAGRALEAGRIFHEEGHADEAIRWLQQVPAESADHAAAAALLGSLFRARGLHSLALTKLEQAIGGAPLGRDNLGLHYELATVHEAGGDLPRAIELYEKILAVDYHHADVGERLARARAQLETLPPGHAAASEPAAAGGERAGRYAIVGELGRGGMGIVYKARDTVLDRVVAYKVLPDALKENPQALRNFLREAKSAAQLNHPNIVTVYDAGEQGGRYYIAMEFVDGTTLKEILRRRGRISSSGIVHVLRQMCEALAYAHDKKIVHRDVKTANTMWTRDRKAKIMDFGLAKAVEEVRNHTTLVSGTPYYMSPEQTLGHNVDHRTDIYSLGVTAFELATGRLPFPEGNVPYHHVHTAPPDPRELTPDLPVGLARVIGRCLEKDPAARYTSTREIIQDLRGSTGKAEPGGDLPG